MKTSNSSHQVISSPWAQGFRMSSLYKQPYVILDSLPNSSKKKKNWMCACVEARSQCQLFSSCFPPWLYNCHHQPSLASFFSFPASCPLYLSYWWPQVHWELPTCMYVMIIPWAISNLSVAFFPKEYNFPFSDYSHQPLSLLLDTV